LPKQRRCLTQLQRTENPQAALSVQPASAAFNFEELQMNKTEKTQTKPTVDREAVRMLAIELGAREAARRLGIKQSTVLSWARRYDWKLPKRKGGATLKNAAAITMQSTPAEALIATHKELEGVTKTALMQTLAKAAQQVAQKQALDVSNTAQLRDICLAAARLFGWDGSPVAPVTVNTTVQTGIVCDEATRKRIIELREQIGAPIPQNALEPHKEKVQAATPPQMLPAPTSLPAPQTQIQGAHGAEKCTVETKHEPIPSPDNGIPKWVKDIGTAESWKHGKGE
jgi:putative ATPase subunit gpP of terminase